MLTDYTIPIGLLFWLIDRMSYPARAICVCKIHIDIYGSFKSEADSARLKE